MREAADYYDDYDLWPPRLQACVDVFVAWELAGMPEPAGDWIEVWLNQRSADYELEAKDIETILLVATPSPENPLTPKGATQ